VPLHVDENGRERWSGIVYVIELDPEACSRRSSPCKGSRCGRIPVYVGETAVTALERFEQHKRGYRASSVVKRFGVRVRPRLAGGFAEMATVTESRAAEAELARRLRKRGNGERYCVYGGH
jgi:hypothetical protein